MKTVIKYERHKEFKEYPRTYEYVFQNTEEKGLNEETIELYGVNKKEYLEFVFNYSFFGTQHYGLMFVFYSGLKVGLNLIITEKILPHIMP